ncbi:hypothetical protein [Amycolatopsis sp. H20-H5]|uniref:hypothetical protein n=1 Tax=Amycolatopsis sp. H20-H5 TaxID=3046309 RepID=UPI002DBEBD58|nr:hypothetical protein [Amycolatopsis sp. H20-H5]MEC3979742.1 hypothetical protein [Amycolatopsis sp. H20-H5]
MRTRRSLVALGGALILVLSGCGGNEAGPKPKQGGEPGPDALPIKLTALTADECYLSPAQQLPKGCEKYVTELSNTAGQVRKRAGDTDPRLSAQADALTRGVSAFRSASCTTQAAPGGACTQALTDLSSTLTAIQNLVKKQATTG